MSATTVVVIAGSLVHNREGAVHTALTAPAGVVRPTTSLPTASHPAAPGPAPTRRPAAGPSRSTAAAPRHTTAPPPAPHRTAASPARPSPTASPRSQTPSKTTVNGQAAETRYGPVQVQIVVSSRRIVRADAIDYPQSGGRDQEINSQAIPELDQQALQAQSARIDGVSGATYTSDGYRQSLQSALDAAHQAGLL